MTESTKNDRQFSIKRARSEAGHFCWVLEGFGDHRCFVVCDTWEEAMEHAKSRLNSGSEDLLFADGL